MKFEWRPILGSIKARWQLVLVSLLNLPMFICLILVLYVYWVQIYAPELWTFSGMDLLAYAIIYAMLMPFILAFSIISIPFLLWYLWKLGRIVQPLEVKPQ